MKLKSSCLILLSINSLSASAEVTLDGTLGRSGALPGPDYLIGADLGRQHGGNLFHSFQGFNLNHSESATFSGPNSVSNIISRVTGGNLSQIDGLIRSTIPNADMYFLNPYGVMFGPNARLDVQGSFHASTADYLRLGDGGRFDVRNPSDSLLTVAPIEAFGFLNDTVAPLSFESKGLIEQNELENNSHGLTVLNGKTISVIGGDIDITKGSYSAETDEYYSATTPGNINAPEGRINLVSVASAGEVIPTASGLDISSFEKFGNISFSNHASISVSGDGAGSIFIRSGQFFLIDSAIQMENKGDKDSGITDIQADFLLLDGSDFFANAYGKGRGEKINIFLAESVKLVGADSRGHPSSILTGTLYEEADGGDAGDILIKAKNISIADSGWFGAASFGTGKGGDIILRAKETVSLYGISEIVGGWATILYTETFSEGHAGQILIEAKNVSFKDGAGIIANTWGKGDGGSIIIRASESVELIGGNPYGENQDGFGSNISAIAKGEGDNVGKAGDIFIKTGSLSIVDGALIVNSSLGSGQGGKIILNVGKTLAIDGDNSTTVLKEPLESQLEFRKGEIWLPGDSSLTVAQSIWRRKVHKSGIYSESNSESHDAGNAGDIVIKANTINLTDNGTITTSAEHATGGNITIVIPNLLFLREGQIITSVHGGTGDGGNITIENPLFVVLNQGKIRAQADEGHGGNIYIKSGQFLRSNNSIVTASSRLGLDGNIEINSPDENVAEGMLTLSSDTVDTSTMTKKPCEATSYEEYENRSSFDSYPIAGSPTSPFDLQPSRFSFQSTKIAPTTSQKQSKKMTIPHPRQMAVVLVCQPVQPKTQAVKKSRVIPEPQLF
jgi:filamentous hemagglutinin family protein